MPLNGSKPEALVECSPRTDLMAWTYPAFDLSPDGKEIAYVSDGSGENEIVVRGQDGKGAPKKIKVPGAGFYSDLAFSPDGNKLVLPDNSLAPWIVHLRHRPRTNTPSRPRSPPCVAVTPAACPSAPGDGPAAWRTCEDRSSGNCWRERRSGEPASKSRMNSPGDGRASSFAPSG